MKKVITLVVGGMILGVLLEAWYENGTEPIVYANQEAQAMEVAEPKQIIIEVDYSGWSEKRIIEEILKELPPVFIDIARCESGLMQYYPDDGAVVRGHIDRRDTGLFQINKGYHLATANELGLNLEKTPDNIKFAAYLYERDGLSPWNASRHCWEK